MPKESKIDLVKEWLRDFARAGMDKVHVEKDTGRQDNGEWEFKAVLYTETHSYDIVAIDRQGPPKLPDTSYLGCFAKRRYPLLGEHWRRGNDLADGSFTRETWEKIKDDIISYELVRPAPEQTTNTATFENLTLMLKGVLNSIEESSLSAIPGPPISSFAIHSSFSAIHSSPSSMASQPGINRVPIYISPETKEKVIDFLQSILEMAPIEILPELITSEDDCLRIASARCTEQHTPKIKEFIERKGKKS